MEVQRQFDEKPHLLDENPTERPDYDACIAISTQASLKEMVAPGAMVIFTPLATGIFFGVTAVSGLLVGALVASIQLAISILYYFLKYYNNKFLPFHILFCLKLIKSIILGKITSNIISF